MVIHLKRCTRCVIPETAPKVTFDEKGVCSYCASYKKPVLLGEEKLRALLDTQRRPGKKYDCVVGISGGRDSGLYRPQARQGLWYEGACPQL